jgi:uncharacterized protein (DUF302 family)
MIAQTTRYGTGVTVDLPYEQAVERTREALAREGFGVLLLPCNLTVYAADQAGSSVVAAMDPAQALELTGNDAVRPLAREVRERLRRVLEAVGSGAATTP